MADTAAKFVTSGDRPWGAALLRSIVLRAGAGSLVVCLLSAAGCNSENPFDQVQVEGVVSYDDGTPIPGEYVELEFLPQAPPKDERTHPRPGRAAVNTSTGKFDAVTSHKYGDGIVAGKHKVLVHSLDSNRRPTGAIPDEYGDPSTTPLTVDTADAPFRLTVRKP